MSDLDIIVRYSYFNLKASLMPASEYLFNISLGNFIPPVINSILPEA